MYDAITDVPGILVGHATNPAALTGCTVVLCPEGAVGGVDVRGSAPGTRETDLLRPGNLVEQVHGVLLTGGSAFGLDAAAGVVRYLNERGYGFPAGPVKVPLVPAAVVFDLQMGEPVWPDALMGYEACTRARAGAVAEGSIGAGTGATVGKVLGVRRATRGGIGSASLSLPRGVVVGAIAVVNAFGDVVDPATGGIVAGARRPSGAGYLNTPLHLQSGGTSAGFAGTNTTLVVVATNAALTREQTNKLAQNAQNGVAQTIRPAHTMLDGDTAFALSHGRKAADLVALGAAAEACVQRAILRGVLKAKAAGGVPAAADVGQTDD